MLDFFPEYMAALAAIMSAIAAWIMLKRQKFQEENRLLLLKHESEVKHLQ